MNEELRIIITAVTDAAQKNLKNVQKEVKGLETSSKGASGKFAMAMKGIGIAAGAAVTAIAAVGTALVALGKKSESYRKEQAKLNTAFLAAGSTTEQAAKSYNNLYRFLGDSSKATEAAGHLAKLTTNEQELAEWTTALQGVYATFGDSLPIEGLTEAANESARVGVVTGTLADALNWAGVNEDAFNASLAACNTTAEREALIRNTLNGLYSDAAAIYEKNNADIIAQNEAQARLDATMGKLGKTVTPFITSLINLSNVVLTALGPAIEWISGVFTKFINIVAQAISWVSNLFSTLTGKSTDAMTGVAQAVQSTTNSVSNAAGGASGLSDGLADANKQAEKLKRTTAGFDELNVMKSDTSTSSGTAGGAGGSIGGGGTIGGFTLETGGLLGAIDETEKKVSGFVDKVKSMIGKLSNVFAPTIAAWSGAFDTVVASFNRSKDSFRNGLDGILSGFSQVGNYILGVFIPDVVNSFSTNLAPLFGDVWGFQIEEAGRTFEWLGGLIESVASNIVTPALDTIKNIAIGTFEAIGEAWDARGASFLSNLGTFFANIRRNFDNFYQGIILPVWTKIKSVIDDVWANSLQPLVANIADAAIEIGSCILELYNKCIQPVVNWIAQIIYPIVVKVVSQILDSISSTVKTIGNVINGLVTIIKGIIQYITGVFTGDWKKAWEGVKNIFKGIFDSFYALVKTPFNSIISGLNGLLKAIANAINTIVKAVNSLSFTVPDWVPGLGGKSFGFNLKTVSAPQIPMLATGGIVTSATQIIAGERGKEAILPLDTHTEWMDKLAEKIAEKNSNPSKIVLVLDDTELGWANIRAINGITKQTGRIQLAMP